MFLNHGWLTMTGARYGFGVVGIVALGLVSLTLSADEAIDAAEFADTDPLWEWRLAAFGRYGPAYPASEEGQFNFVPLPFPIYRGKYLRLGEDSDQPIKGRIFRSDRIELNVDFDATFGSDSDDIEARTGMPDLDFMLEGGPELILPFTGGDIGGGEAALALQLRGAFSWDGLDPTWRGVVFNPELRWVRKLSKRGQEVKIKVTPGWASSDYMDYYYSVSPQFATPARSAFEADSGYLGTEISFSARQPITDKLEFWAGIRFGFYQGTENEDSPLFTKDTTTSVYGAFMYKFWEGKTRVPRED